MSELERFAAALLAQWRSGGGTGGGPIGVTALIERVLPYRTARRLLGIDASEDYEALVLRLVAEEEHLVTTDPLDAAEMAKATVASKLPDLDVLQLLRAATVTLTPQSVTRLADVLPMPAPAQPSAWAPPAAERAPEPIAPDPPAPVTPLATAPAEPGPAVAAAVTQDDSYLTTVHFTPPAVTVCWSCGDALPGNRAVKFCPECGADQRDPVCAACGAAVEHRWKHCPECGAGLRTSSA
jgi:predicted RNA-binding Zn-ribbon protein involved in translation (DUF1610 family)